VSPQSRPPITTASHLSSSEQSDVLALAEAAAEVDGTFPLDDQVRLDLEEPDYASHRHLIARWSEDDPIIGYAHLDTRTPASVTAHIAVHPDERRHGIGTAVANAVARHSIGMTLNAWSHGDHPGAAALAESLGWGRVRDLWQMHLPLDTPIGQPHYPRDTEVRTFVPGRDEQAWVELNAAAFAHHPEQGRMTVDDLEQRERQPWFDRAGFFLATQGSELMGFHWTKVHPGAAGEPPVGEVYVVGVDPSAQGLGLGKALTLTGLHHLREQQLDVILYVDATNKSAVAVYERTGFTIARVDVMYQRPL
jgi:mycothiol synthase